MSKNETPKEKMRETLFNAFTSTDIWNPQEYSVFWAIEEGFNRTTNLKNDYRISTANKEHKCIRNCKIEIGEKYFTATYNWHGIKLCVSCMAMILYFGKVWSLPTFMHDYWDEESKSPHLDENSSYWKSISDAMEKLD